LIIPRLYDSETDPLALASEWFASGYDFREPLSKKATIKIFNDKEKFEEYQNRMQE